MIGLPVGELFVACRAEEKARSPTGLLTVQIGKMECGQFVGKIKPDKDVERMARNAAALVRLSAKLTLNVFMLLGYSASCMYRLQESSSLTTM